MKPNKKKESENRQTEARRVKEKYQLLLVLIPGVEGVGADDCLRIYVNDITVKLSIENAIHDIEGVPIKCIVSGSISVL